MNCKFKQSKFWALVPCAGAGMRSGAALPKQYVHVAGAPVVMHTLAALQQVQVLEAVIVVIAPGDTLFEQYCSGFSGDVMPVGGKTRAQSVRAGLYALRQKGALGNDWVLVHDAARCLIQPEWVQKLIEECQNDDVGGLLACPVADTLKQSVDGRSVITVVRHDKWLAQTPQMFRLDLLERALDFAEKEGLDITDEASSIEALGLRPKLVECSAENFKLTYPDDFKRAESILVHYKSQNSNHGNPTWENLT